MLELIKNTNIDFMGKRVYALVISGILSILGIVAIVQVANGRANLGIDFAGGTAIQLKFEKPIEIHAIRKALEDGGIRDFDLQARSRLETTAVRVKKAQQQLGQASVSIKIRLIAQKFPDNKYVVDSTMVIGPKVGGRLRADAAKAVALATLGILSMLRSGSSLILRLEQRSNSPRRSCGSWHILSHGPGDQSHPYNGAADHCRLFTDRYGCCL